MGNEQVIPLSSLGIEGMQKYSIINTAVALQRGHESKSNRADIPLVFSHERGDMPILMSNSSEQANQVYVVANSGALFMNSLFYPERRYNERARQLTDESAISSGTRMLVYSKKEDPFVYMTTDETKSVKILETIAESFRRIGIELSQVYQAVSSIDEWLDIYAGQVNILPNVLDPELLLKYAPLGRERHIRDITLANVSAYTKNGVQRLWQRSGIPTPETAYYDLGFTTRQKVQDSAMKVFANYERVVMNRVDGSGGFATVFVSTAEIADKLQNEEFRHQKIQLQGMLPVINSPCYIANIYPDGSIQPLAVSVQIFSSPGRHAGNYWRRNYDFTTLAPDFEETNLAALKALSSAGVVGQVNIDSMIVSESDSLYYGVPTTTMREANIRPAGSSVIDRLNQGNINEKAIYAILTSSRVCIPKEEFSNTNILDRMDIFSTTNTQAVLYNYNFITQMASIAFCGTEEVTEQELLQMKQNIDTIFL